VGPTSLLPSRADCLEILGTSSSRSTKGLSRPVMEYLFVYLYHYLYTQFGEIMWYKFSLLHFHADVGIPRVLQMECMGTEFRILQVFYICVTIHRDRFPYNETTQMH
jgi:hypothetical protein